MTTDLRCAICGSVHDRTIRCKSKEPRFWVALEDGSLREDLTSAQYERFVNVIGTIDGGQQ